MKNNKIILGFWAKLSAQCRRQKKPIMCLAPMSDVTDEAFRQMFVKYGKPDVFWTEFVSVAGLCSRGRDNMLIDLKFKPNERPIVAQIFGANPECFYESARFLVKLGFDGIDINMGCPDRKIEKQGAGAALMKNYKLAQEIILATKEGARLRPEQIGTPARQARQIPISVKTRIGYNKDEIETWIPTLLEAKPEAIILHGRTRKEMSRVPAHWDAIGRAAKIVKASKLETLVIGNGDVVDLADAYQKAREYKLDGIMVGRAVFGNPWWFCTHLPPPLPQGEEEKRRLKAMIEHAKLFEKLYKGQPASANASARFAGVPARRARRGKNFNIMKKHFKAYAAGFEGAKELRVKLMKTKDTAAAQKIIKEFINDKKY